ncbi:hypothetical protein A5868_001465 [Enterococcus sp. 12F9_DIV0723]|nr:hypothetical protein A5868_001465 [Enterococcus sp. 12F9_DIV0723]
MKTKVIKKLLLIFFISLILPITLLLQKYNRHLSYDPSFSEIFFDYVRWIFGIFIFYGLSFFWSRLKK